MQLFVLGMHRSGTSAVTRILNMAGAYFGPEGMSNGADEGNPKGFWERLDVRAACDGLLHESGFDWWRVARFSVAAIPEDVRRRHVSELQRIVLELDAHRPWVVKEPRLSLLFPLLRPSLEVPVCIHVARDPLEVAGSLSTRNGFAEPAGLAMWEAYTIHGFAASERLPRLLVRYDELVRDPVAEASRLLGRLEELGVQGLRTPGEREITAFVTPDLHRQRSSAERRAAWLNEPQERLAAAIDDGSILETLPSRTLSESAVATLAAFEDHQDQARTLDDTREQLDSAREELTVAAQHSARADDAERRLADETLRRREVERAALAALDASADSVRALGRSRIWRVAWSLSSLRLSVASGRRHRGRGPLERVVAGLETTRADLVPPAASDDQPPPAGARFEIRSSRPVSAERRARSGGEPARPKVAVIAWDVGHNPVGRAHSLAGALSRRFDVEIWGAQFERYGTRIWAPLRESTIPVRHFDGQVFPGHLAAMEEVARHIDADAIYVSKPRLPSYALGVLAKERHNRPLVLDVDDNELAFFDTDESLAPLEIDRHRDDPDVSLPFGRTWTRIAQHLVESADQITVSNIALQERFGGLVVPHARDETVFDPDRYDHDETRHRLGVSPSDRLLLFGGTPRVHKGILEILRAVDRLADDRYRVALFGTRELEGLRSQIGDLQRWVLPLPHVAFDDLAPVVAAADLACVLQDPAHPVSRYQMPAKVTDALAMGVPILVSQVPPLRPLIEEGVLQVHEGDVPLHARIARVFEEHDDALDRARKGRKIFLEAYSYEAVSATLAPTFERLLSDPPPLTPALRAVVQTPRRLFATTAAHSPSVAREAPVRVPGRHRGLTQEASQYDVVVFWKQNDTGIYGRRQDMFVKYLAQSERVHTIVHFDRPMSVGELYRTFRAGRGRVDQNRLVARETVRRLLHQRDADGVRHRTFLHSGAATRRWNLEPHQAFPSYVRSTLARNGVGRGRPTIFWVYPTNDDLPEIIDVLDPDIVVADLVDDHRTFATPGSARYAAFERNYREVLARSDVVLANCAPVAEAMARFAPEVHVVPNGCEVLDPGGDVPRPKELEGLRGPVIGYVGNLSQRLDISLLEALVTERPGWHFVFVGSAHHNRAVLALEAHDNMHFLGARPYEESVRFMRHFDVGIIPHVDDRMTRSMNPLKAFVYCSTGLPVVSTPVANLELLEGLVTIADGPTAFAKAIERALESGRRPPDRERLAPHSWTARVEQAIQTIDRVGADFLASSREQAPVI